MSKWDSLEDWCAAEMRPVTQDEYTKRIAWALRFGEGPERERLWAFMEAWRFGEARKTGRFPSRERAWEALAPEIAKVKQIIAKEKETKP